MLEWLNPDWDQAVKKYENIWRRLIQILAGRGCHEAEDLSDEVIDRVVAKIDDVTKNYEGDRVLLLRRSQKSSARILETQTSSRSPEPIWPPVPR